MSFFRFRLINTVLFFLIGILLGFIFKEKFYPAPKPAAAQSARPDSEDETPEVIIQPSQDESAPVPEQRKARKALPEPERAPPPVPKTRPAAALPVDQNQFFARPAAYAGREIEMSLQMITAKRSSSGWRLNLVHVGSKKKLNYLYVDDGEILEEKPDLRIGYYYRVKFHCGKGETADGNTLSSIEFTGQKADWATGLSAIE